MKINRTVETYRIDCPYCDEFLEMDHIVSSSDVAAAIMACGTWAGMHVCYKRRVNIARETGRTVVTLDTRMPSLDTRIP